MTATAKAQEEATALEPIEGGCPACRSTVGAYGGCCRVCGCPTPDWQRQMAAVRALAFGAPASRAQAAGSGAKKWNAKALVGAA